MSKHTVRRRLAELQGSRARGYGLTWRRQFDKLLHEFREDFTRRLAEVERLPSRRDPWYRG